MDRVLDKLASIQRLWIKLRDIQMDNPEHEEIIKQIGALSAEYQALVDQAINLKDQSERHALQKLEGVHFETVTPKAFA
jgi:hypothetical protein